MGGAQIGTPTLDNVANNNGFYVDTDQISGQSDGCVARRHGGIRPAGGRGRILTQIIYRQGAGAYSKRQGWRHSHGAGKCQQKNQ